MITEQFILQRLETIPSGITTAGFVVLLNKESKASIQKYRPERPYFVKSDLNPILYRLHKSGKVTLTEPAKIWNLPEKKEAGVKAPARDEAPRVKAAKVTPRLMQSIIITPSSRALTRESLARESKVLSEDKLEDSDIKNDFLRLSLKTKEKKDLHRILIIDLGNKSSLLEPIDQLFSEEKIKHMEVWAFADKQYNGFGSDVNKLKSKNLIRVVRHDSGLKNAADCGIIWNAALKAASADGMNVQLDFAIATEDKGWRELENLLKSHGHTCTFINSFELALGWIYGLQAFVNVELKAKRNRSKSLSCQTHRTPERKSTPKSKSVKISTKLTTQTSLKQKCGQQNQNNSKNNKSKGTQKAQKPKC